MAALAVAGAATAQTLIDDFSAAGAGTGDPPGVVRTTVGTTTVTDARRGDPALAGAHAFVDVLANGLVVLRYDANGVGLGADLSLGDGIQFDVIADLSSLP